MRKVIIMFLIVVCVVLLYFTFISGSKILSLNWELPNSSEQAASNYQFVLITQELETPFWDKVAKSAIDEAEKNAASLEVWGSYGNNQEDFLKKIEIAIYSQVDGIIVQGLDTDAFKELTNIKAASYGIPIITVANDVPIEKSLRKTYVGSDQYLAGKMIGKQLVEDMGENGKVAILMDAAPQYFQEQRREGIKDVLKEYPQIEVLEEDTSQAREKVIAMTKDLLNRHPDINGIIAIKAEILAGMIHEIESRSQIEPYYIYSFDDNEELTSLLNQRKVDGIIEQSPAEMGEMSVKVLLEWMNNEKVPLDLFGYQTDIRIIKAEDR
ncbi:sugar ABC transporter substrate-binding protein [Oceanobacillus sp. FSL H7-0719]|uniref:sugar ABC transporter substrate-binding protein n=1 Tax=Oceanobacillus sp. FSL H7-0719 TaxID=2954507 RepID=UPI00324FC6C6